MSEKGTENEAKQPERTIKSDMIRNERKNMFLFPFSFHEKTKLGNHGQKIGKERKKREINFNNHEI